jgi:3-methyladenine DNA glycosylase AlkD
MDKELRALGSRERAVWDKAYLKSEMTHLGVTLPRMRAFVRGWLKEHENLDRDGLVKLARAGFASDVYERRAVAVMLLHARQKLLGPEDVPLLEELIRASKTWALVDDLAPHVMGPLVERTPKLRAVLRRWAHDGDFWLRRAALLSLLVPLRQGAGDFELFEELAEGMVHEKEFFIRKAIGWVLREVSKKRPELVHGFLDRHPEVSGLTRREATKYL